MGNCPSSEPMVPSILGSLILFKRSLLKNILQAIPCSVHPVQQEQVPRASLHLSCATTIPTPVPKRAASCPTLPSTFLASRKPVPGAKKVGDHCCTGLSVPVTARLGVNLVQLCAIGSHQCSFCSCIWHLGGESLVAKQRLHV